MCATIAEIEHDLSDFRGFTPWRADRHGKCGGPSGSQGFIVTTAARYKLPAVYYDRNFAAAGGLVSYGP